MSKVFGYPEYDEKGEKILTTYDNEYKAMMMDIRVYRMKAGETRTFLREGEQFSFSPETLLINGTETRRQQQEKMCSQKDHGAFTDAQEQRSQLWQMQSHRSLFSAQRMKKISVQNFINRKMLRGDIPVWANSEMLQREG